MRRAAVRGSTRRQVVTRKRAFEEGGERDSRAVALIGRAADSKSAGWGFESLLPCKTKTSVEKWAPTVTYISCSQ